MEISPLNLKCACDPSCLSLYRVEKYAALAACLTSSSSRFLLASVRVGGGECEEVVADMAVSTREVLVVVLDSQLRLKTFARMLFEVDFVERRE